MHLADVLGVIFVVLKLIGVIHGLGYGFLVHGGFHLLYFLLSYFVTNIYLTIIPTYVIIYT